MSLEIFKQNMLSYMRNQRNIGSKEDFAKKLVQEYDAAVKRGFDTINNITISQGNTQAMEATLIGVLNTAFQQSSGEHAIITNMGKAFQAYWSGATMNLVPPPLPTITPMGVMVHITQVSNFITNPGTWGVVDTTILPPPTELEDVPEESLDEAIAIKRDVEVEYPKTQREYEKQFPNEAAAFAHNKNVDRNEVIKKQDEIKTTSTGGGGKDAILFQKCGNGLWPALGPGPSPNFEVSSTQGARTWYKQNSAYIKQNCTQILFPTSKGDKKITVHKDLAAIVQPALDEIRKQGLQKYIENCAGGLAVRNVTGGTRLSNHSWGTAIDMNTIKYPYGYKFGDDGIYVGSTKKRNLDEFDRGFLKVAKIFQSKGMTWLKSFDPMHVSIYE